MKDSACSKQCAGAGIFIYQISICVVIGNFFLTSFLPYFPFSLLSMSSCVLFSSYSSTPISCLPLCLFCVLCPRHCCDGGTELQVLATLLTAADNCPDNSQGLISSYLRCMRIHFEFWWGGAPLCNLPFIIHHVCFSGKKCLYLLCVQWIVKKRWPKMHGQCSEKTFDVTLLKCFLIIVFRLR